jgi:hypothetical protein
VYIGHPAATVAERGLRPIPLPVPTFVQIGHVAAEHSHIGGVAQGFSGHSTFWNVKPPAAGM